MSAHRIRQANTASRRRTPVAILLLLAAGSVNADQVEDLRNLRDATIGLVNDLVEQGVLSREKADAIIHKALTASAPAAATGAAPGAAAVGPSVSAAPPAQTPAPPTIRVPYIPEAVKQEIHDQLKQDVLSQARSERWGDPGALPEWLGHISFNGDVRVRFEDDRFPAGDVPNASPQLLQLYGWNIDNTTTNHDVTRLRVRFGATAQVGDTVSAGFRLASGGVGSGASPVAEYQTLGNYNSRGALGFDRAYITYGPASWLHLTAGRLGQPFFAPTSLVWADDLSLEGFVLRFTPELGADNGAFVTAGAFPILDVEPSPTTEARSRWLYAAQLGAHLGLPQDSKVQFAVALYDYQNIQGIPDPSAESTQFDLTAAPFRQKGNTYFDIAELANSTNGTQHYVWGLASSFREVNAGLRVDLGFYDPFRIRLDADVVRNIGFDQQEILRRTGLDLARHVTGYQAAVTVGNESLVRRNAWQVYFGYRHAERDAVLDAFTDSDFRLGGTDAQGYYLGGRYAFENHSTINLRWLSGRQIDYRLSSSQLDSIPLAIDVLQIDLMTTF